jgi:phospholipid N-methyltransferase
MSKIGFLQERRLMWQAFRKDFFHTGSVMPSSRYLGRELAACLAGDRPPARILEIGPGTGPVTAQILPFLKPGDQFDAVEINGDFVEMLSKRFPQASKSPLDGPPAEFRLLHAPIQDLPGTGVYQHLISGLPFNNFPIALVEDIWISIHRLAAPGATFSFFEYLAVRQIKAPFVAKAEKERLAQIGKHLAEQSRQYETHARKVFMNVPPAVVHHLKLPGGKSA